MNKNPKVSAVIAAHNEELHLADCIKSLLSKSHKNLEIIIVENGNSRDKTLKIAKKYEKKYKNVSALTIPGKQKGPGNAWNCGVKKSKGKYIIICGADLIYGKDYIKNGISILISNRYNALVHREEKCNNLSNLWARAFFKKRSSINEKGLSKVFTIVRKKYVLKNPFDSKFGYADDQTVYRKKGTTFPAVDLEVYHTNPASFKDTWDHSIWVGRSIKKPGIILVVLPVFFLWAFYKSLFHLKKDFYLPFIFFLPLYYAIRYFAYFIESFKKLFLNKIP